MNKLGIPNTRLIGRLVLIFSIVFSWLIGPSTVQNRVSAQGSCAAYSDNFDDNSLSSRWHNALIGGVSGNVTESGQVLTLTSSDGTIWDTSDRFHYLYQGSISGDFAVSVKLNSMGGNNGQYYPKAGLMVRESTAANSKHVMLMRVDRTNDELQFARRTSTGGNTTGSYHELPALPQWLRLVRQGNEFHAYYSTDGNTWVEHGASPYTVSLTGTVLVGLVIAGGDGGPDDPAEFDDFSLCINTPPNAPTNLQTTNVDTATPQFAWTFSDPDAGDTQGAWQIQVGTDNNWGNGAEMWDSGVQSGSDATDVYAGLDLQNAVTYYWRVRTRDNRGTWGGWSAAQFTSLVPPKVCVQVSTGNDDAEELGSGWISLTSSDLELVQDNSTQTVGMRFQGVNIPASSTIINAYIEFTADEAHSGATNLSLRGQAADNPPTFTSTRYNVSNRPTTSASAGWNPGAWSIGTKYKTPDLASIVQELVGRPGWSSGNAMVFIVTGSGRRVAESYNGGASLAPKLCIFYNAPDPSNHPPNAPTNLQTTGANTPTPTFAWLFSDPDAGDTQGGWQIQVGTDNDWGNGAETWDTGPQSGSDASDVYSGAFLQDGATYYWRVRNMDNHYAWGDWSGTTSFTYTVEPGCQTSYFDDGTLEWNSVVWGSGAGAASESGGLLTLTHTGQTGRLMNHPGRGHYYYYPGPISGDFDLRVRIYSLSSGNSTDDFPQAGLVVRDSASASSDIVWFVRMNGNDANDFQMGKRDENGRTYQEYAQSVYASPLPDLWMRLVREGSMFTAYYSWQGPDGPWMDAHTQTANLANAVIAGLYFGGDNNSGTSAQFDNAQFCWGGAVPAPTPTPPPGAGEADLRVYKEASPEPVGTGSTLVYNVTVVNYGPNVATNVRVTDTLPAEVTFVSATPDQGTCSEAGGVVTCDFGLLNAGVAESVGVEIVVTVNNGATGTVTNQASATTSTTDPDLTNNSASVGSTVVTLDCSTVALGTVLFLDPVNGDGGKLGISISGAGTDITIASVEVDWGYLDDWDESNAHKGVYLWGVYISPGSTTFDQGNYIGLNLDDPDSPSTASSTPQTLPGTGGYILVDFDATSGQLGRLDDSAVWGDLQASDFGFTVTFENNICPAVVKAAAGGRVPLTPTPTPTLSPPTPTPTPMPSGTSYGTFDNFELCPPGVAESSPVRPKPPGLKDCASVLVASDIEPADSMSYWIKSADRAEYGAVERTYGFSCDKDGRGGAYAGDYSLLLRCDRDDGWPYPAYHPWSFQLFSVPAFVSTTEDVALEMTVSLYYMIPKERPPAGIGGSVGRTQDKLRVAVKDPAKGVTLAPPVVVSQDSAFDRRGSFHAFSANMADHFALEDYAGKQLQVYFDAPNPNDDGDTEFYIDQVKCDVCATVNEPPPEGDKAYRVGGSLRVLDSTGRLVGMAGVDVWAIRLQEPDDSVPADELISVSTYSIQDSTYTFYNLTPGTYQIYAEIWIDGRLRWASIPQVTIEAGPGNTELDMTLMGV